MQTPQTFSVSISPATWNYLRQVLGTRPHDEVAPLIQAFEREIGEQQQRAQFQPVPDQAPPVNPLKHNGSGIAEAVHHAGDPAS